MKAIHSIKGQNLIEYAIVVALVSAAVAAPAGSKGPLRVTQLVPGFRYSYALISDGTVRVWGGHSDAAQAMKRFALPTPPPGWKAVTRLVPSGLCAVDRDGAIECVEGSPPLPQQVLATQTRCAQSNRLRMRGDTSQSTPTSCPSIVACNPCPGSAQDADAGRTSTTARVVRPISCSTTPFNRKRSASRRCCQLAPHTPAIASQTRVV